MKTYLITGGAGFIGSTLSERLIENNKIIILDNFCDFYDSKIKEKNISNIKLNKNIKIYKCDIRDKTMLKKIFDENEIDCVIHLAAMAGVRQSIENPNLYQDVNCNSTQNILEEMKNHNIKKLVFASSSSVYGNCKETPFKENMSTDYPISPYAATKKANEIMIHVYHKLNNIDAIILRFFTVYGPKQRPDLAISKFTKQILKNEEISMYGDGTTSRDYTYIDDLVDGIIKSINYVEKNKNIYEIINLGNSKPILLKEMIKTIGQELNIEPKIKQKNTQCGDVETTYADITKAKKLIGYKPQTTFKEGIKKYIEWYKKNNK